MINKLKRQKKRMNSFNRTFNDFFVGAATSFAGNDDLKSVEPVKTENK